jgi:hypothetical protein
MAIKIARLRDSADAFFITPIAFSLCRLFYRLEERVVTGRNDRDEGRWRSGLG